MKLIAMIIEDTKIIRFLVKLAKTGMLKHLINILEPQKIIQVMVLVTITIVEILMEKSDLGVLLLMIIQDGSFVNH
jgi:hypothetical protein